MRLRTFAFVSLVSVVSVAGCDSDSDADKDINIYESGQAVAGYSLDELGDRFAETLCARMFECCTAAERGTTYDTDAADEATCVSTWSNRFTSRVNANWVPAIEAGEVKYTSANAKECLDNARVVSCGELQGHFFKWIDSHCNSIEGVIENGKSCGYDDSCATGYCEGNAPGMCKAVPGNGENCEADATCDHGLYCGADLKCHPREASGGGCRDENDCVSGLCDATTKTCVESCNGI